MGKITIWGNDDIKKVVDQLPDELKNNPAFVREFVTPIENALYWDKKQVDVIVSNDGKDVQVFPASTVDRDPKDPNGHQVCTEYKLDDYNNIEVIRSEGTLHEADSYYANRGETKPDYRVTSVLDTYYERKLIDKDGIEMARGTFYKSDWPLTSVRYDDIGSLNTQLLSEGRHKPSEWRADGIVLPQFAYNAHVSGVSRSNDNPAFANSYGYDIVDKQVTNNESFLTRVHGENPESLRVDETDKIAKYVDRNLEACKKEEYEGYSLEEIFRNESLRYEEILNMSRTKSEKPEIYEVLKNRLEQANSIYKNEQEINQGRSM